MAKSETRRLKPSILVSDRESLAALRSIAGYSPTNSSYALTALTAAEANLASAQSTETQAAAAADAARDNAVASEWTFHDLVLGMKDQILAQFGRDSNEAQSVGLKKKSEYKRPGKRTASKQ